MSYKFKKLKFTFLLIIVKTSKCRNLLLNAKRVFKKAKKQWCKTFGK